MAHGLCKEVGGGGRAFGQRKRKNYESEKKKKVKGINARAQKETTPKGERGYTRLKTYRKEPACNLHGLGVGLHAFLEIWPKSSEAGTFNPNRKGEKVTEGF